MGGRLVHILRNCSMLLVVALLFLGLLFLNSAVAQDSSKIKKVVRSIQTDKSVSKTVPATNKKVLTKDNELQLRPQLRPLLFEDEPIPIILDVTKVPVPVFYSPDFSPQFRENFFVSDFSPRFSGPGPTIVVFPPINMRWE